MNESWVRYSKKEKFDRLKMILEGYEWFKMLDATTKLPVSPSSAKPYSLLETLSYFTEQTLSMKPGEMDLIVMIHFFKVLYPNSNKVEIIKSSLVKSGSPDGLSAMS